MNAIPVLEGACALVLSLMPEIQSVRYRVRWKEDGSPVTDADLLLERTISEYLSSKLPRLTLIGEETFQSPYTPTEDWLAVLDPIDGTENFCSGLKEWGISLSLWHASEHRGSLLFLPELGDRILTGDVLEPVHSRIVGFSSSFSPEIAQGLHEAGEGRIFGCAVYNLYNVIRGSFSRFVNPKGAYVWDLLAGLMLAREHDCDILVEGRSYDGRLLDPGQRHRIDIRHRYDLHSGKGTVR